jgi:Tol biopolymer transport system component
VPSLRGSHPSVSPDGRLWVTDGMSEPAGGKPNEWGILVADMQSQKWVLLHSFDQSRGAKSWRRSHPHPAFSADGKRIYYNVSDGEFTRLFVAEIK